MSQSPVREALWLPGSTTVSLPSHLFEDCVKTLSNPASLSRQQSLYCRTENHDEQENSKEAEPSSIEANPESASCTIASVKYPANDSSYCSTERHRADEQ
jgi:hypothetical protein